MTEDETVWMVSLTQWTGVSMDMGLGGLWELVMGQGGLVRCGSWDCKESDMTE